MGYKLDSLLNGSKELSSQNLNTVVIFKEVLDFMPTLSGLYHIGQPGIDSLVFAEVIRGTTLQ